MPIHLCHPYHWNFCGLNGRSTIESPSPQLQAISSAANQCNAIAVDVYPPAVPAGESDRVGMFIVWNSTRIAARSCVLPPVQRGGKVGEL